MEALKLNEEPRKHNEKESKRNKTSIYRIVWRWHFYAGLIFSPFLIILAFSGAVYLFKPQIESFLYQDLYYVKESHSSLISPSEQISLVKEKYPEGIVNSYKTYDDPLRTSEISISNAGQSLSVFVDPYTGTITGSLNSEKKFTEIFKKLHSELIIGGTFANRLVELAACWCVILLITGLYIWWPRNKASIWGTILPRFNKKGRIFWRDMHAVPAFWLSIFVLILIGTGLPWSGVMGEQINRFATATNTGTPPYAYSWDAKPESIIRTKDVAQDGPWATENLAVPSSETSSYSTISLEDVSYIAGNNKVAKPYTISMPQSEKGVYTVTTSHTKPGDNATLNIDQYSGAVLTDVRFNDYGITAKAITVGIALHEGRLFGLANQIIGLIVCMGLIGVVISSFIMWKKRKPSGKLGAPSKVHDKKLTRTVFFIMLVLGIVMPLVGISIILVFLLDRFVLPKFKPLRGWIN
ncbi:PepSY-associated TM helix domain-containing protein [Peribacillus sp. NPDC096379]|uniref:PepSY-associated TM helix domain-containing protein n=1 Tax=Peribacillus sp. NPDC096379 TaxID=3364393 RepID=UPI0038187199